MRLKTISGLLVILFFTGSSFSCTTFVLRAENGSLLFGRNFDFPVAEAHIHINYSGSVKSSFIRPPEVPINWISKYGSITFNQAGREFPYGGMNEAGLVIEQMWLREAKYPDADERHGLNELQWIQYQLDNSASVQEVIDSDSLVRISYMATSFIHFLIADARGQTAVIEFIDGKMKVHKPDQSEPAVLSNCTYQHSLAYMKDLNMGTTEEYNEWTKNSSGRFSKAAEMLTEFSGEDATGYAFRILDSVYQPNNTQWSIVYDINAREIQYRSSLNEQIQTLLFQDFDFSCNAERKYIPIESDNSIPGNFRKLKMDENLKIMQSVVSRVEFLKNTVPQEYLNASAAYAETVKCLKGK